MATTPIEDKIAALLRKAEATTNEHERDAFNAKATELMIRAGIEEAEIRAREAEKAGQARRREEVILERYATRGLWGRGEAKIGTSIAKALGLRVFLNPGDHFPAMYDWKPAGEGQVVQLVGFKSDIERAKRLIESIVAQAREERKRWWKSTPLRAALSTQQGKRAQANFLYAYASAAGMKVEEVYGSLADAIKTGSSTELAIIDRKAQIDAFADAIKSGKARNFLMGHEGHSAGWEAGKRVKINSGEIE